MTAAWPKVYLGGPAVFRPNAKEIGEQLKQLCARYRLQGLWPADNDPPDSLKLPADIARHIFNQNLMMIGRCAAVIADISPFRGPHMDCGTAFEIGAAVSIGRPVFAYTNDLGDLACRMTRVADGDVFRDSQGDLIEHFGLPENLMIACSVETVSQTAEQALQQCVQHLRSAA